MTGDRVPATDDGEDHVEGCLCGTGHRVLEHEATADADLPAAMGGVRGDRPPRLSTAEARRARGLARVGEL